MNKFVKALLYASVLLIGTRCGQSNSDKIYDLPVDFEKQLPARIKSLEGAIKDDPKNASLHYQIALMYLDAHDVENAYINIKLAVEKDPDNVSYKYILARCFYLKGLYQDALDQLQTFTQNIAEEPEYALLAIDIYIKTNEFKRANGLILALSAKEKPTAQLLFKKGYVQYQLKDTSAALQSFTQAYTLDSGHNDTKLYLADIHNKKHAYGLAYRFAKKFLKSDSTNSINYYNLAVASHQLNKIDTAIYFYEKSIKYDSNNTKSLYDVSQLYMQLKQYDRAEKHLRRIIAIKPGAENLNMKLGFVLQNLGKLEEALYYFETIDSLNLNYNFAQKSIIQIEKKLDYRLKRRELNKTISNE